MVYTQKILCPKCRIETEHINGICSVCAEKAKEARAAELKKKREAMTLEERVAALEEWVDNFKHQSISPTF